MKKTLIVIGGPTAIGKTKMAIKLAKKWQSEIISSDARQFYKELNIGVGKPSQEDLDTVPHHFIGHKSVQESYSVGQYEKDGLALLHNLFKKHDVLFLCGGSGLYIQALCEGLHQFPEIDKKIKTQLNQELKTKGLKQLNAELKTIDIETYHKIDKKNPRRVLRALEVYRANGKPYSFYTKKKINNRHFRVLYITLKEPREMLYNRINNRVDIMIKNGLIQEAKKVYIYKEHQALQTIGYQEMFKYFNKELSLDEAVDEIKKNTRRYAKRQITWFNKIQYHDFLTNESQKIIKMIQKSI